MKKTLLSFALISAASLALTSCGAATDKNNIPLTLSSQELDGVFNPFFSTSAPDSNIVSMTQISMLTNDKDGNVACGKDEAVVVDNFETITTGVQNEDMTTTYNFVLKNDIKFSNGSPLTIRDVLFNLYVYLDPVYTGSSTIYSTDIVGLKEYRTQQAEESEQEGFMEQFQIAAQARIQDLVDSFLDYKDSLGNQSFTEQEWLDELNEIALDRNDDTILKDYKTAIKLFNEELESDYTNSMGSYESIVFKDKNGQPKKNLLTTDVEAFLYNENYISFNRSEDKIESTITDNPAELKSWNKEKALKYVYNDYIPMQADFVIQYWSYTSSKLFEILTNDELAKNAASNEKVFKNISGIKFANKDTDVTVNGVTYPAVERNEDNSVKNNTNEVLSITINNVDPKAIWNFSFPVAPMYYYSNEEQINKFDYVENFGVDYSNPEFMEKVVKAPEKVGVPVGAGPYMASKVSGGTDNVTSGDFKEKGIVYFEANPNFILGKPKIRLLRYKVIAQSGLLNAIKNKEIDFIQPNANPETINQLNDLKNDGIHNKSIKTSGYGYIGINASKVPSIYVRQVIMHTMDTQLSVDFYGNTATPVYRSLSTASWAYPKEATPYYPYIGGKVPENLDVVNPAYAEYVLSIGKQAGDILSEDEQSEFIRMMLEDYAGYTLDGNGVYVGDNHKCKYTFTIAGAESDHPAWQVMFNSSEILNKNGFEVIVQNDANALTKLNSGALAIWAAAWGSTIDPDLYQIYHMESKATSVNNWGYKAILQNVGDKYSTELGIVEELSGLIDDGRSTLDKTKRKGIYAEALDLVMQLAVELPTYQRDDLFAYNVNKIDEKTLVQDTSPFNGLLSQIWNVALR